MLNILVLNKHNIHIKTTCVLLLDANLLCLKCPSACPNHFGCKKTAILLSRFIRLHCIIEMNYPVNQFVCLPKKNLMRFFEMTVIYFAMI